MRYYEMYEEEWLNNQEPDDWDDDYDDDLEMGFNPYEGCYDWDC